MIDHISIENFRSISKMDLDETRRLTLVSGRNNIGKSTLLEAIFLMMDHSSPDSFLKLGNFRGSIGSGTAFLWDPLFHNLDTNKVIKMSFHEADEEAVLTYRKDTSYLPYNVGSVSDETLAQFRNATVNLYTLLYDFNKGSYREEGHFVLNGSSILRDDRTNLPGNEIQILKQTQFLNDSFTRRSDRLINDMGNLELKGEKSGVIQFLQLLDKRIQDIVTLSLQGITQLYIRMDDHLIPLQYAGDGVMKLLNICLSVMNCHDGLVLIDEIESGFHYSMYETLWNIIDKVSKEANCQVIATTHSYEMISAAGKGILNIPDFAYYRLGKSGDRISAFRYSYEMLMNALDCDMEVR